MRSERRLVGVIVGAAIAVRLLVAAVHPGPLTTDPDGYARLAESIAAADGFVGEEGEPTAFRPPLVPLLFAGPMAWFGRVGGLLVVQLALSAGLVGLTWWFGRRWGGAVVGLVAAGIVAVDPMLVLYSLQPMTEVAFAFLTTLLLVLVLRISESPLPRGERRPQSSDTLPEEEAELVTRARDEETAQRSRPPHPSPLPEGRGDRILVFAAGLTFGLAALCRPTIWAWAVMLGVWMLVSVLRGGHDRLKSVLKSWAPAWLAAVVVVLPWVVRNAVVLGRHVLMTTHGGYTLLLANNRVFDDEVVRQPWGTIWQGESLVRWQASLEEAMAAEEPPVVGELARDEWMRRRAVEHVRSVIAEEPSLFLRACLVRAARFWNPAPLGDALPAPLIWGVTLFNGIVLVLAILGWWIASREQRAAMGPAVLLMLSLTLVHTLYWSNARMRAPVIPIVAILAARAASSFVPQRG